MCALTALKSKAPSSLNNPSATHIASLLARQQQNRCKTGRGNIQIGSPPAGNLLHDLQKEYSLPTKSPKQGGLPPLEGTVKPAPGAADFAKVALFPEENTRDLAMAPQQKAMSVREIEKLGTVGGNKKSIWFKKEHWDKVIAEIKALKKGNNDLIAANKDLTKENKRFSDQNEKLAADYDELKEAAEKGSYEGQKQRKGGKKRPKGEQREDINKAVKGYVKSVLFRTHKFVQPGKSLKAATKLVWEGIKDNMQLKNGPNALKVDKFVEIYESTVLAELSARRQYHQSRCWTRAAIGTNFA